MILSKVSAVFYTLKVYFISTKIIFDFFFYHRATHVTVYIIFSGIRNNNWELYQLLQNIWWVYKNISATKLYFVVIRVLKIYH